MRALLAPPASLVAAANVAGHGWTDGRRSFGSWQYRITGYVVHARSQCQAWFS